MIEIEREISFLELEQRVRDVPLLHSNIDSTPQPYSDSEISIQEFKYTDLNPTTLYVLRENLEVQASLATRLGDLGFDPLNLNGGLELTDASGNQFGLLPPIVEEAPEGAVLIDGIHRNYHPRLLGRTSFLALYIQNIHPEYPVYAYPNEWHEIKEYDEVPKDPQLKKKYRVENPYHLYRDFKDLKMAGPRQ